MRVEVSRRRPEDEADLVRIYAGIFGDAAAARSQARWRWQYVDNPHAAEAPAVWVARVDGRPVGQMGTMPVTLWWGDREVRASWGMDYFVEREAEGRGLGVALARAWMASIDVALALGLTPPAYAVYRRLGFADLGQIPFYQTVLDASAVAARRLGRGAGRVIGPVVQAGLDIRARLRRPAGSGIDICEAGPIGPEYDGLWIRARAGILSGVRRDAPYLRWKYREVPHRRYELLEARRSGELVGFAVSRHEDHHGLRLGWLVDLFTPSDEASARDALIDAVLGRLKAAGVARAEALCANAILSAQLARHGFFPGSSRTRFCARAADLPGAPLEDPAGWHLVFGDSDMDR